jgi:carboxypeptidase PM20D1
MFRRFLLLVLVAIVALVIVVLFNTLTFKSKQTYEEVKPPARVTDTAIHHLQRAVQFKTVSYGDPAMFDSSVFDGFHEYLKQTYPLTHQLPLVKLAGASLLFEWQGSEASLNPFVLMAHQDVVPIEEASRHLWTVDPFAGVIRNDTIWGRGTVDNKINVIGIFEAVEKLLAEGFRPKRTIYLAFGHDEEVGGTGAKAIASYLAERKITADLVLDEGGIVTLNKVPGLAKPVALLGTAEKGYLSLQLTVEKNGGHSSMPERESALSILSKALVDLYQHPFPAGISEVTKGFIEHVGPEMTYPNKIVFANAWLFKPVVVSIYEQSPGGNAMVRTTSALTIFHSGVKDNVIPSQATATVNFRLLPGDSSEEVIRRVEEIVGDERVKVSVTSGFRAEPSLVTPADGVGFKHVARIVHQTWEETLVAPFLMIGGTDSRHMQSVSTQIIKFSPMTDPIGFHGIDERVSIQSFEDTIGFFENLIRMTGE